MTMLIGLISLLMSNQISNMEFKNHYTIKIINNEGAVYRESLV